MNDKVLARVQHKLERTLAELEEMEGRQEPAYLLGWAAGGIRSALIEIEAWRDPDGAVTRPAAPGAARPG